MVATIAPIAPPQECTLDKLPAEVAGALLRFRDRLLARFPGQISHVILFGSQARGEATVDSDVDVMIVVPWQGESFRRGDREIGEIAYDLLLEGCAGYLSPFVIEAHRFEAGQDVAAEARREGVELLTAQLVAGRLIAARVEAESPVSQLKETPASYAADEPTDLNDPQTWLVMAADKIRAARVLLAAGFYNDVISMAYYAMLYAAKAALLAEGVRVKSHRGAVAEFGRVFVKTGRVADHYGSLFGNSLRDRLHHDYAPDRHTGKAEATVAVTDAESFVTVAGQLIETRA